jgi:catechol 2,3-dioxygenase-like lactoylglutathione lyase family enzyme
LRVVVLEPSVDFYTEAWGLRAVERDRTAAWLRGTGDQHHVLSLVASERNALHRICFAVASPDEVDNAARRLELRGIPLVTEPGLLDGPGEGYGLRFPDPEGRLIELSTNVNAVAPVTANMDVPTGVAHVVLNTTDIDAMVGFYQTVLGLRVSDWSEHQMAFLRCNQSHHCVAFNQAPWASLNHVAFELPTLDGFMRGLGRLRHHDITPMWGPGRHGPGNNTFAYFVDPAGLVCEYTSEVAQIDEAEWIPRVWPRNPEMSDLWGTAGQPSAEIRAHMSGEPDPGIFERDPALGQQVRDWHVRQ